MCFFILLRNGFNNQTFEMGKIERKYFRSIILRNISESLPEITSFHFCN